MDKTMTSNTPSSVYRKLLEGYKECLKTKPSLPLRSYCRDNNLPYEKILDWTNRQGVFVKELKGEVRSEEHKKEEVPGTFIQFRAQPRPSIRENVLKGVSIIFPDTINLSLQECTVESLVSFLWLYHTRK